MKKVSTAAAKQSRNFSEQSLTIGLDLGDRSSWYCVLDETGEVLLEKKVSTTPKAMKEVFGGMPRSFAERTSRRCARYYLALSSTSACHKGVSSICPM
jgi:hypothetical protein